MDTVRVVHVIGVLDRGGAETVALDLCRAIPSELVEQHFICLAGRAGELAPHFERANATIHAVALRSPMFPVRFLRLLLTERFDVIVSHVSLASAPLLLVARIAGVRRRIARFHSEGDGRTSKWRWAYRWTARWLLAFSATSVLAVTQGSLRFALGSRLDWFRRRGIPAEVLHNGVDTQVHFYDGRTGSAPLRVVHIGRAAPEKNRKFLPHVKAALDGMYANEFVLFGSPDLRDIPEPGDLRNEGMTDDVAQVLRTTDVLVLPSEREGLPGVVLEALASGVPVVATDLAGLREIRSLTSGTTLVPFGALAEVWAQAIDAAGKLSESERADIARRFRESPFALNISVAQWLEKWGARANVSHGGKGAGA